MSFEHWINQLEISSKRRLGTFSPYIRDVFNIFKRDQILIMDGDILTRDPALLLQQSVKFLGLPRISTDTIFVFDKTKGFFCLNTTHPYFKGLLEAEGDRPVNPSTGCFNNNKGRQHPEMSQQIFSKLLEFYRTTTEELFELIGKRFDWEGYI